MGDKNAKGKVQCGTQTCAAQGGTGHCAPAASQVCPCRAAGIGEFVVGEMASQPPVPPPLRAVPLAQQQGAQGLVRGRSARLIMCVRAPSQGEAELTERGRRTYMKISGGCARARFRARFLARFLRHRTARSNMTATDLHSTRTAQYPTMDAQQTFGTGTVRGFPFSRTLPIRTVEAPALNLDPKP